MPTRYKKISFWRDSVDELLVDVFLEAHPVAPEEIVLDLDTTDLALHGKQEGRFYHGHYGHYCYLPLYIFCGDHVLCARLRPSSSGPAVGSQKEVERIVQQIRLRWPEVRIILRGDSGFCADQLMTCCEQNRVGYVLGMARNQRLERRIAGSLSEAKQQFESTQQAARIFVEFEHETLSGSGVHAGTTRASYGAGILLLNHAHTEPKNNPAFHRRVAWGRLCQRGHETFAPLPFRAVGCIFKGPSRRQSARCLPRCPWLKR
jgi:hypothetical protein